MHINLYKFNMNLYIQNIASYLITQRFEPLKQLYIDEEVCVALMFNRDFCAYRSVACMVPLSL
jgi:hypothetical protein